MEKLPDVELDVKSARPENEKERNVNPAPLVKSVNQLADLASGFLDFLGERLWHAFVMIELHGECLSLIHI